jgi:myosin-3
MFQLCTGGSVTDLVQGLKRRNERLTEDQIAYIIRETVEVMYTHIPIALRIEYSK